MALWKKGEETVKVPLHMSDLASGVYNSLSEPAAKGAVFEAYGPHRYRLCDLLEWMAGITNRDIADFGWQITDLRMDPITFAKAFVSQNLPVGTKHFGNHTIDKLERVSNSCATYGGKIVIKLSYFSSRRISPTTFWACLT